MPLSCFLPVMYKNGFRQLLSNALSSTAQEWKSRFFRNKYTTASYLKWLTSLFILLAT